MSKCVECGFLSLRNCFTGQLEEAGGDFRATGNAPRLQRREALGTVQSSVGNFYEFPYNNEPLCFVQVCDLTRELQGVRAEVAPKVRSGDVVELLQRERPECEGKSIPWQQGFTPKEHREIQDRQWMIVREDRRDREMREREDRRDAETRRLQERLHRELWIIGGGVTIALIVGAIAAAVIEGAVSRGFEPSWWPF